MTSRWRDCALVGVGAGLALLILLALQPSIFSGEPGTTTVTSTSLSSTNETSSQLQSYSSLSSESVSASQTMTPFISEWLDAVNNQSAIGVAQFYANSSVLHLSGNIFASCLPYQGPFIINGTNQITEAYSMLFSTVAIPPSSPYHGQLAAISNLTAIQTAPGVVNATFVLFLTNHQSGDYDTNATILVQQGWLEQRGGLWIIQNEFWNYVASINPDVVCAGE